MTFRFDSRAHEYLLPGGEIIPHVTGMLQKAGLVDATWYTDASRERGSAVHRLCTDFDLGSLTDIVNCTSPYKGWLQAHAKAMGILQPRWLHVEEPMVHQEPCFGGRPDRVGYLADVMTVMEIKSGPPEKSHPIQTALQAILAASEVNLPAHVLKRGALYLTGDGKFKYRTHDDRRDFTEARRIIQQCCGG